MIRLKGCYMAAVALMLCVAIWSTAAVGQALSPCMANSGPGKLRVRYTHHAYQFSQYIRSRWRVQLSCAPGIGMANSCSYGTVMYIAQVETDGTLTTIKQIDPNNLQTPTVACGNGQVFDTGFQNFGWFSATAPTGSYRITAGTFGSSTAGPPTEVSIDITLPEP